VAHRRPKRLESSIPHIKALARSSCKACPLDLSAVAHDKQLVSVSRDARPQLHECPVRVDATLHIEALAKARDRARVPGGRDVPHNVPIGEGGGVVFADDGGERGAVRIRRGREADCTAEDGELDESGTQNHD
jgi:hypothetical protein